MNFLSRLWDRIIPPTESPGVSSNEDQEASRIASIQAEESLSDARGRRPHVDALVSQLQNYDTNSYTAMLEASMRPERTKHGPTKHN